MNGQTLREEYPYILYNGLIPLGIYDDETTAFTLSNNRDEETSGTLYIGMLDMDRYLDTVRISGSESVLEPDSLVTGRHTMDMEVNTANDGYIFVPLYAEDGWSIFVNGERIVPANFFNVFYLVPVKEGKNSIHFSFLPRKLKSGLLITLLSIFCLIILHLLLKNKSRFQMGERIFQIAGRLSYFGLLASFTVAMVIAYIIPVTYQLIAW